MGGRLRKSKHGGDSAVEYVSSGNKLIKKKKGGGIRFLWHSGQVDDQFFRGDDFFLGVFFLFNFHWDRRDLWWSRVVWKGFENKYIINFAKGWLMKSFFSLNRVLEKCIDIDFIPHFAR